MRYFLLCLMCLFLVGCDDDPREILKKYHYLTQVPPVAAHGPGSLVWKRGASGFRLFGSSSEVSLGYICDPAYVKPASQPIESSAAATTISGELGGNLSFTGAQLGQVGVGAAASAVKKVDLKIENVSVIEYPLQNLRQIRRSLGPICKEILQEQRKKRNAYQVISVVKADISYRITYTTNASAEAKSDVLKQLSAKFGLNFTNDTATVGKGLFYGVELDKI